MGYFSMDEQRCLEWLRLARDDLDAARFLLGMKPRKIEIICYHCQQCAEKSLKSILAFFEDEISRTHDLRTLLKQGCFHFHELDPLAESLAELQPYAVSVRYPYEIEVIEGDEEKAIAAASLVHETCKKVLGL